MAAFVIDVLTFRYLLDDIKYRHSKKGVRINEKENHLGVRTTDFMMVERYLDVWM